MRMPERHRRRVLAIVSVSLFSAAASLTILRFILLGIQPYLGRSFVPLILALIVAPLLGAAVGSALLPLVLRITGLE